MFFQFKMECISPACYLTFTGNKRLALTMLLILSAVLNDPTAYPVPEWLTFHGLEVGFSLTLQN